MIDIKDLNLIIKKKTILLNINTHFEKGLIHGLVGRNGSGKTVLMKCICGFMKPSSGTITVREKVIGKDCDFPADTGVIIETPRFINHYSGLRNLKMLANINRRIGTEDVKAAIRYVGLDPDDRLHVGKYSLGMRQRLGLAQAIMEKPSLLILDEPFNGLDKEGVVEMRRYLAELRSNGTTILIASHSAEDIDILCNTVREMDSGKMSVVRS
jgi:ABC-2 type transport system ATP-binding protein